MRSALVVAGVALAFSMLVAVLGAGLVARQQALGRSLAALPASERAFRVDRFGLPLAGRSYRVADERARTALTALGGGRARRTVFFRELRVDGELVEIAAVDELARAVRLESGHLPRTCTAAGCEVLQIGRRGAARLDEAGIRLRRVGTAALRDPALFGSLAASEVNGSAPVLLLAPGVGALDRLASLTSFLRIYSWLSTLATNDAHTWQIGGILAAESHAQTALYRADPAFRLSGPDQALLEARSRGAVAARRLVLVGGETSTLLLGFAIIAAIGLRRGLGSERRRLLARGARRWQVGLARGAEIGSMTLAGAVTGVAAGAGAVAVIAAVAGAPVAAILVHTLLSGWTVALLAGGWLGATLVLVLTTFTREDEGGRRRINLIDVAAIGAATTIVVAVSRGTLDPGSTSSGSTALLLILPALVCFVAAVALARLLGPAMRVGERLSRNRSVSLRLAVLALARAPLRTVVSCAFVAVALGLAFFATAYRATLTRGAHDQAAFEVPLDFTLTEGSRLVLPLDAAPISRYARLPGGARAYPVVRTGATTPGPGSTVLSPTVLGVPAGAITRLHWRPDFSSLPPRAIAAGLAPHGEQQLTGVAVPAGTATLSIAARDTGTAVTVGLVVEDRGRARVLPLGEIGRSPGTLSTRLRPGSGLSVVGIELALPASEQFFLAHNEAEGHVSTAPSGTLELGALQARTASGARRTVTEWRGWSLRDGAQSRRGPAGTTIPFAFSDTSSGLVFRPDEPTDGPPMPVLASPDVAAAAGGIGETAVLDFGGASVTARIIGVAARMPTIPASAGPFVLADAGWLSTAINANDPGTGNSREVWVSANDERAAAAALRRPPFASLVLESRSGIEQELASDPLARATARALGAAAIVALALALLGFWVGIVSELRDEQSDLFDLEVRGMPPERLRAQIRGRGLILVGAGLAGGVVLGGLLAQLVVSLVRVSAANAVPEPPLRLDLSWQATGLGILVVAALALLVAEGTARAAFRSERPERASWSLE